MASVNKRIVLHFPQRVMDRPIVSRLVREFNLDFNILKASITPEHEGLMVLELSGEQSDYDKGIKYLAENGVRIQALSQDVVRNAERCTNCGACVTVCPSGSFVLDLKTREIRFSHEKCLACGLCIRACPPHAMELHF